MRDDSWIKKLNTAIREPSKVPPFLKSKLYRAYAVPMLTYTSRKPIGTNVFERDWDVLIILDSCRVDALNAVSEEYEFLSNIDNIVSVGSSSPEWIANTFNYNFLDQINNTIYVSGNGWAEYVLSDRVFPEDKKGISYTPTNWKTVKDSDFQSIKNIWKYEPKGVEGDYGHPEGHCPPRYVTDFGISVGRNSDFERLILHYQPPHKPYTANAKKDGRKLYDYELNPFNYLKSGGDYKKVWDSYLDQLRYGLDDVEVFLNNIDAEKVIITADHGEAFGEWFAYEHNVGLLHPSLRYVPWCKTKGVDKKTYTPNFDAKTMGERDVEESLKALGYL